jgi:hypothetical protein
MMGVELVFFSVECLEEMAKVSLVSSCTLSRVQTTFQVEAMEIIFFFIMTALGFELRALHLQGRHCYHWSNSTSPFL